MSLISFFIDIFGFRVRHCGADCTKWNRNWRDVLKRCTHAGEERMVWGGSITRCDRLSCAIGAEGPNAVSRSDGTRAHQPADRLGLLRACRLLDIHLDRWKQLDARHRGASVARWSVPEWPGSVICGRQSRRSAMGKPRLAACCTSIPRRPAASTAQATGSTEISEVATTTGSAGTCCSWSSMTTLALPARRCTPTGKAPSCGLPAHGGRLQPRAWHRQQALAD